MAAEVFKVQVIFPHFLQNFLQRKSTCSSFDTFKKILIQRYGFLQWNPLKVEWYDTDGDKIRIYNEDDWGLYMELNGTKVNVQIDNRWIYSAKTSFTNIYPYLPTPLQNVRTSTQKEKCSGSKRAVNYDGVESKEHESGLSKQSTIVEIQSEKCTSIPITMRRPVPTAPIPISSQYIHFGTKCNSCLGEIRGYRYKCSECRNYDLCSKCEMQKLHKEHQMIGLDDPNNDTDYDPRFWKATLKKYESKNENEEEDNEEKNSSLGSSSVTSLDSCGESIGISELSPVNDSKQYDNSTTNVNENENNSGSSETSKYDEVQSEVELPQEQTIVENQSEKSAPVLQPIEQPPLITTKPIGESIGICEPSPVSDSKPYSEPYDNSKKLENNFLVTPDCTGLPAVTSDSSLVVSKPTVAETTDPDFTGNDVLTYLLNRNDVRSDLNHTDSFLNKFFDKPSTSNVKTNKVKMNNTNRMHLKSLQHKIAIKKPESNTSKPSMFAGKSADRTADCDQDCRKSNDIKSKLASHPEFRFWKAPPVKNVQDCQPESNASKPTMFPGKSSDENGDCDQGCGKSNNVKSKLASKPEYEFWKVPTNIHHRNPRINESVLQMISMGFSNSGGWLSQLMEKTNGDVVAALDFLEVSD